MNIITKSAITLLSVVATSQLQAVETERQLEFSTQGMHSILVDTGAGSLTIEGKAGISTIEAHAKIQIDGVDDDEAQEWMDKYMDLSIKNKKGTSYCLCQFWL